jgi:hypothetical protein
MEIMKILVRIGRIKDLPNAKRFLATNLASDARHPTLNPVSLLLYVKKKKKRLALLKDGMPVSYMAAGLCACIYTYV